VSGGTSQFGVNLTGSPVTIGTPFGMALAFAAGAQAASGLGSVVTTGTGALIPTVTTLYIGSSFASVVANGYVRRIRYWIRALSSAELQEITTVSTAIIASTEIDSSPVGLVSPSTGAFTTLSATSTTTIAGGVLTLGGNALASDAYIAANAASAHYRGIYMQTGGVQRWGVQADNTAESGSNSGTNFGLVAYSDSGSVLFNVVTANRATGALTVTQSLNSSGPTTLSGTVSGAGITSLFASPPAIGGTAAAAGSFTTLAASGNLTVGGPNATLGGNAVTGTQLVHVNSAAGNTRGVQFESAGAQRWLLQCTGTAESGSNVGSDFILLGVNDAVSVITAQMTITRATGLATFANGVTATGALTTANVQIDTSAATAAPATGGSVTIASGVARQVINPAGTLATLTVTSPAAPSNAAGSVQELDIYFTQAITALTWASGSGASYGGAAMPTTVAIGAVVRLWWVQSLSKWMHTLNA